jgi:hypothetical protein
MTTTMEMENKVVISFNIIKIVFSLIIYDNVDILATITQTFLKKEYPHFYDDKDKILMMIKLIGQSEKFPSNDAIIVGKVCYILCSLIIYIENIVLDNMTDMIDNVNEKVSENTVSEGKYKSFCDLLMKSREFLTHIKKYPFQYDIPPSYEWVNINDIKCINIIF